MKWKVIISACAVIIAESYIGLENHETGSPLSAGARADKIVVNKSERRVIFYRDGKPLKSYQVALGRDPVGRKEREGDNRTPEGIYRIDYRKADSAFHRALHISYPNASDIEAARKNHVSPGGAIMIHGIRNGFAWVGRFHPYIDWTAGCIAVSNSEIEEIMASSA